MGSGYSKMKKQARAMGEQVQKIRDEAKSLLIVGESGAGRVKVTMNGEKEVLSIQINKECVDVNDLEGLQDLLVEACKTAHKKAEAASADLEGQGLPFGF